MISKYARRLRNPNALQSCMCVCERELKCEDLLSNHIASSTTSLLRIIVVEILPNRIINNYNSLLLLQITHGPDTTYADCWQGQET